MSKWPRPHSAFRTRRATPDDIPRLVSMRLALQQHIEQINARLFPLAPDAETYLSESFRASMTSQTSAVFVVEQSSSTRVVGMAVGTIQQSNLTTPESTGCIENVWIDSSFRHRGLCRRLLGALIDFFRGFQVQHLVLDYVVGSDEAAAVWSAFGFQPVLIAATASVDDLAHRIVLPYVPED